MFEFNPDLVQDDDMDAEEEELVITREGEEVQDEVTIPLSIPAVCIMWVWCLHLRLKL